MRHCVHNPDISAHDFGDIQHAELNDNHSRVYASRRCNECGVWVRNTYDIAGDPEYDYSATDMEAEENEEGHMSMEEVAHGSKNDGKTVWSTVKCLDCNTHWTVEYDLSEQRLEP